MAYSILFISTLVLIHLTKGQNPHDINTPSQSDPRNQLLINTTSTQRPLLTLEALMNESLLTTNPTNNIPSSSNSIYANSSKDNISPDSTSITFKSRQMTLLTLIGTGIFITVAILIIRARYGICKTRLRKKMSVSESNMAQSMKTHVIESEVVKPQIQHHNSQQGVAADNMVYGSDGESAQNTPQSRPSGNSINSTGLEHVADPPQALEMRLSIADSVNKHYHKSPKGSDSMNQRIKEYLQSQLHDNEIAGHRSRLSVASAHSQQWKMILAQGVAQPAMEQQASAASSSNCGEHTHTMTKSVEIGYAEYQNIYVGQRIDALQEDEEVDVFDVREPGSPCPPCPKPYMHIQHFYHDSLDGQIQNVKHAEIKIPSIPATDGIAEDEFVVDDGESSVGIMTHGEEDVDETPVSEDGDGNETNESDPEIPESHDSDNDIIMDMDMNTKGFIE